nr:hypothetical protein [Leptospira borgpetersenii]
MRFGEFSVRQCEEEKKLKGYLYIEPRSHWTSYQDWTKSRSQNYLSKKLKAMIELAR